MHSYNRMQAILIELIRLTSCLGPSNMCVSTGRHSRQCCANMRMPSALLPTGFVLYIITNRMHSVSCIYLIVFLWKTTIYWGNGCPLAPTAATPSINRCTLLACREQRLASIARSRKRDSERQLEEVSIDWRERLYLHDLYWELAFGLYVVTCMYYCTSLGYYNKL